MKIAILGAGAWGKALATVFFTHLANSSVLVWSRGDHGTINNNINIINDISRVATCNLIFIVVPAQNIRDVCIELKAVSFNKNSAIIICSKGIECSSLCLLSEVVSDELSTRNIAVLSGPNFAHEVIAGLPCAASLACADRDLSQYLINILSNEQFALHPNVDVIGTQIFGAVKNVIAIACGIFEGKNLGQNAKSALITLGLHEITDLVVAKGGERRTALLLGGVGDLMLTCNSHSSRNVSFGIKLSKQKVDLGVPMLTTVEGLATTKAVYLMAKQLGVQMPICESVYNIIYNNSSLEEQTTKILTYI